MMNKSIEEIVEFLIDKKLTITTAESCTGGLIASAIVDIPGVSEIFHEGYVTYYNRKQKLLKNIVYIIYTSKLDFIKIKNRIVDSECGLRISA